MYKKRTKGHTLVEVLFAVALCGICALIMAATMPMANTTRAKADLNNRATSLAQKQLEAIKSLGYANATTQQLFANGLIDSQSPVATNTYAWTNSDAAATDNPAKILPSGTATVKLEQVDLDLRRVTVVVNWKVRGANRSISIGTLIANL
ncbi:MAG: prepilin-type N-terminal cleavage/methylation domain-containing protein [Fimbriimonadaceae bacterium]|nr:prepilin-type N-terminal cleavage/methylation domain-containing protein [Fimbriimonadaceae bacterium]